MNVGRNEVHGVSIDHECARCGYAQAEHGTWIGGMDNKRFWNERYNTLPELGSGAASRGWAAIVKQEVQTNYCGK